MTAITAAKQELENGNRQPCTQVSDPHFPVSDF
jgi:hypothetical protein